MPAEAVTVPDSHNRLILKGGTHPSRGPGPDPGQGTTPPLRGEVATPQSMGGVGTPLYLLFRNFGKTVLPSELPLELS